VLARKVIDVIVSREEVAGDVRHGIALEVGEVKDDELGTGLKEVGDPREIDWPKDFSVHRLDLDILGCKVPTTEASGKVVWFGMAEEVVLEGKKIMALEPQPKAHVVSVLHEADNVAANLGDCLAIGYGPGTFQVSSPVPSSCSPATRRGCSVIVPAPARHFLMAGTWGDVAG